LEEGGEEILFLTENFQSLPSPPLDETALGHATLPCTAISKKVVECFVASCIPRLKCTIGDCECNQQKVCVPEISKIFLVLC
jgi:hypothetical protein